MQSNLCFVQVLENVKGKFSTDSMLADLCLQAGCFHFKLAPWQSSSSRHKLQPTLILAHQLLSLLATFSKYFWPFSSARGAAFTCHFDENRRVCRYKLYICTAIDNYCTYIHTYLQLSSNSQFSKSYRLSFKVCLQQHASQYTSQL